MSPRKQGKPAATPITPSRRSTRHNAHLGLVPMHDDPECELRRRAARARGSGAHGVGPHRGTGGLGPPAREVATPPTNDHEHEALIKMSGAPVESAPRETEAPATAKKEDNSETADQAPPAPVELSIYTDSSVTAVPPVEALTHTEAKISAARATESAIEDAPSAEVPPTKEDAEFWLGGETKEDPSGIAQGGGSEFPAQELGPTKDGEGDVVVGEGVEAAALKRELEQDAEGDQEPKRLRTEDSEIEQDITSTPSSANLPERTEERELWDDEETVTHSDDEEQDMDMASQSSDPKSISDSPSDEQRAKDKAQFLHSTHSRDEGQESPPVQETDLPPTPPMVNFYRTFPEVPATVLARPTTSLPTDSARLPPPPDAASTAPTISSTFLSTSSPLPPPPAAMTQEVSPVDGEDGHGTDDTDDEALWDGIFYDS